MCIRDSIKHIGKLQFALLKIMSRPNTKPVTPLSAPDSRLYKIIKVTRKSILPPPARQSKVPSTRNNFSQVNPKSSCSCVEKVPIDSIEQSYVIADDECTELQKEIVNYYKRTVEDSQNSLHQDKTTVHPQQEDLFSCPALRAVSSQKSYRKLSRAANERRCLAPLVRCDVGMSEKKLLGHKAYGEKSLQKMRLFGERNVNQRSPLLLRIRARFFHLPSINN
eukprot:TRINITY_DN3881_c0_g1_i1.p1 TRINITY_DN3881_c0_g1~~TRINITY_DN3881_c0_g1_i1.p1  ORF type:complete len:222 (-),score=41.97 TRINITY_DN3881_c0_g1_i1:88-753(-)